MQRTLKQLLIAGIFLVIVGAPFWVLYRSVVPAATCRDGIQNQQEEGVDCGVVCGTSCPPPRESLQVFPSLIFPTVPGAYDVVVRLGNPNGIYGASRAGYTLVVTDAGGTELARRHGFTYVNPAQPRYLIFSLTGLSSAPANAQLQLDAAAVQWGALELDAAGLVSFAVQNENLQNKPGSVRYQATVINRSSFDFDTVDVTILLRNAADDIVGAGSTVLRTLTAGELRDIAVDWPFPVSAAVTAEVVITTNIFDNENFIRAHGSQERFQGF